MKLIVEIDDEIYKTWRREGKYASHSYAQKIILNGTPLPKEHGRLKDADIYKAEVYKYIAENKNSDDLYLAGCGDGAYHALHIYDCIATIIEANKEDK